MSSVALVQTPSEIPSPRSSKTDSFDAQIQSRIGREFGAFDSPALSNLAWVPFATNALKPRRASLGSIFSDGSSDDPKRRSSIGSAPPDPLQPSGQVSSMTPPGYL